MSDGPDDTDSPAGDPARLGTTADVWPVALRGVTESVVATRGPEGRWNLAALGLHAPEEGVAPLTAGGPGGTPVTARTWGNTRTRRNFEREGGGVVQFVADPRPFVEAALTVFEADEPVHDAADAWVRVSVTRTDAGESGGTRWREWALHPGEGAVLAARPYTINRGFAAVVDATVAASRLDVPAYDTGTLRDRLRYFAETVDRCGGPAEREAFARLDEVTGWREKGE